MVRLPAQKSWSRRLYRGVVAAQTRFVRRNARQPGVYFDYFPELTPADETANSWTHGIGSVLSVVAAVWLIDAARKGGDPAMVWACFGFCAALTTVLSMSALSHWVQQPRLRHLFRTLDQASIYVLIAASCGPFFLRFLSPNGWGWMLPLVWGAALVAVWNKLRGDRVNSVSVSTAVGLAWLPAIAAHPLLTHMPAGCVTLILAIAGLYMVGVVFLCLDHRRKYFHAIWHVLVVLASACTYAAIFLFVI
jgi:hemolysin III